MKLGVRAVLPRFFDEVNEQMGSSSDVLAWLADEFPNHYKSYAKASGLVQP